MDFGGLVKIKKFREHLFSSGHHKNSEGLRPSSELCVYMCVSVRLPTCVCSNVSLKVACVCECFVTPWTLVRLFTRVEPSVGL